MKIFLVRHGRTAYNDERRYQGKLDIPLSAQGESELCAADLSIKSVYVSPLLRARQTAVRIFPLAEQMVVDAFSEMDFGAFDGRTAVEMEHDAAYRAWVDGGCTSRCPGGESRTEFCERSCAAFETLLEEAFERERRTLAIVTHGGTICAVMERFALPRRGYFDWAIGNGCGYMLRCDAALWRTRRLLELDERLCFAEGGAPC